MSVNSNAMHAAMIAALVLAGLWSAPSEAQWAWKDGNGRVVYSDRPPPSEIRAANIMRQPSTQPLANPAPAGSPLDDAAKATDAKSSESKSAEVKNAPNALKTVAEREMEFRKRQQERAESEKKVADEQTKAATKTAECDRARGYMKSLDDGVRITRTDANGNREFLDDAARAAEADRTRKIIQSACG